MDIRKGAGLGVAMPPRPAMGNKQHDDEIPELTESELKVLRKMLEDRRAELVGSIEVRAEQERDTGREVGDEMDEATIEGATAMASKLLERDVKLLAEIDRALAKFPNGTYGFCEGTGEPIGFGRLRSRPWARFSVEHQEQLEREARTRGF